MVDLQPPLFDADLPRLAPRMLAVDLASDRTGLAYTGEGFMLPMVWTFRGGTKPGHARNAAILAELMRAAKEWSPTLILLEDLYAPPAGRIGPGFFSLAFLHGLIRHHLEEHAPLLVINNQHIKIFATGKGIGIDKGAMILAIERRYRHLVTITDDNQADAFALLALARHRYGYPLSTVDSKELPKTHLRALDLIKTWPVLDR